jgi:tricorn protease
VKAAKRQSIQDGISAYLRWDVAPGDGWCQLRFNRLHSDRQYTKPGPFPNREAIGSQSIIVPGKTFTGGGIAHRLTAGLGEPSLPALSSDGQWLAYVGRDEQHPEVYLMRAVGGSARRMTWLGPDVQVRGFTPEGKILFLTTDGQPFFRNYRAFTLDVDVAGGLPEMLPLGQVNHLTFGPGKARVIGRNTADPARWKRYRGGTAGYLWADAEGNGEFTRIAALKGNITCPMWIGERIYFLSDSEGVGNLYSCRPDSGDVRRHTDHDDYYARFASTDSRRIVYQCGARIWLLRSGGRDCTRAA